MTPHQFQISQDTQALFITLNTRHRLPVFQKDVLASVLCEAINEARQSAGLLLFAYVVMIDHLHLLIDQPRPPSEIVRIIKGITARRVIDWLKERDYVSSLAKLRRAEGKRNHKYSLWQTERNVLPIFSEGMFVQKANYIHQNPVRAGYVDRDIDYRWSSARIWKRCDFGDEPLIVDIDRIAWRRSR